MAKVKIEELKYIVMEGGGARGTAYLGAVKALENQLKQLVKSDPKKYKLAEVDPLRKGGHGIMDYLEKKDDGKYRPIIEGVSGSSAGAITTFAITLGLNSAEIEEVLNYEFITFLTDIDQGKYRMIDYDSELMIGTTKNDVLGAAAKSFVYDLKKNRTNIEQDSLLKLKRKFIFQMSIKVIGDGLVSNINQLLKFLTSYKAVSGLFANIQKYIAEKSKIDIDTVNKGAQTTKYASSQAFYWLLSKLIFSSLSKKYGMKLKEETIVTLFADNGIFSGFQVREFFYDLLIYAGSRDTYFQKQMLEYYAGKNIDGEIIDKEIKSIFVSNTKYLSKKDKKYLNYFEIGYREETFKDNIINEKIQAIFNHLQNITFRELWDITGIEFAVGVSNYTAGKPLYLSDIYTPHFRVLEAAASSMNIPPIKPLLNIANVFYSNLNYGDGYKIPTNIFGQAMININDVEVKIDNKIVKLSENIDAYNQYEDLVKKYLHQELLLDNDLNNPYVDVNNGIDLHTFLPKLMKLVIGDKYDNKLNIIKDRVKEVRKVNTDEFIEVTVEMLRFYYNSQFKGLFIDGGYYNNIPFNYFRDSVISKDNNLKDKLNGVFAIKLDNNYPVEFIKILNDKYSIFFHKIINLEDNLNDDLYGTGIASQKFNTEYNKLIELVRIDLFENYLKDSDKTQKALDRNAILKLIEQMLKTHKKNHGTIWLRKKSILSTAIEGYSFGAERAQVRGINDNDHIIPLYSYGVGTFDFDLKKVNPMAKIAQNKAEIRINEYFNNPNS